MKTIIINASPRKDWNTDMILRSAKEGAESVGGEVEYYNLYDLDFKGCRSCLACKRRDIENPCNCYWKDDLQEVIDKVYAADNLIIGSPIYFGEVTSDCRALIERLLFPTLSYSTFQSTFLGSVRTEVFLTMNASKEVYEKMYEDKFKNEFKTFAMLHGEVRIHPVCTTQQVDDYDKYEMRALAAETRYKSREEQFPKDLKNAYDVGAWINMM